MPSSINRLAVSIGYPEAVPEGVLSFAFAVDDGEVLAREAGGRLIFSRVLWREAEAADDFAARVPVELAGYAAGRVLRETAVLAWDPKDAALILWQDVPATLTEERLKRHFEAFATSCDWWLERVNGAAEEKPRFPEMMIMP